MPAIRSSLREDQRASDILGWSARGRKYWGVEGGKSRSNRITSTGPVSSGHGLLPLSTRLGAAICNARLIGVKNRRLAQLVPSSTRRSPRVRPTEKEGTETHLFRVRFVRHNSASWATNASIRVTHELYGSFVSSRLVWYGYFLY